MMLQRLEINREYWKTDKPLAGSVTFDNEGGEIKLLLDNEECQRMLEIVADAMVVATKKLATEITAKIITDTPPRLTHTEPIL